MSAENHFESLPPNLGVFVHSSIIRDNKPIRFVAHDTDGDWSFTDGGVVLTSNISLVALQQILAIDPSLQALSSLPSGYYAERRDRESAWTISPLDDDE
jgi:hypothetical protein